jgi:hypothetical protein
VLRFCVYGIICVSRIVCVSENIFVSWVICVFVQVESYWDECLALPSKLKDWDAYNDLKSKLQTYLEVFPLLNSLAAKVIIFIFSCFLQSFVLHFAIFQDFITIWCQFVPRYPSYWNVSSFNLPCSLSLAMK